MRRLVDFTVDAMVDEFDKAFVSQELKLLADFCFDVVVPGVPGFQMRYKGVHLFQCEGCAEFLGALEDIEQPAAAFDAPCLQ